MDLFVQGVRRLSTLCGIVAVGLLLAAVLVVCQLVFVRYVLGTSAIWQHEFVTYSLVAATFLGSPYVLLTRGHVNVDLLPHYLGPRGRLGMALLASLLSLAFCGIIGWTSISWWHEAYVNGWRGETVWAPRLWIPWAAMPLGIGLLSLQYLADIAALLTGRALPFAAEESLP
ncbi:MAG: TRAP transporter small permease [Kiloniellales bacterium]|nr:TRAP transporter small permease [Kiloniellales bacterium]